LATGKQDRDRGQERRLPQKPPLEVHGWKIYVYPAFAERWRELRSVVEERRRQDPDGYRSASVTKLLLAVSKLVLSEIPRDPADDRFRQGLTLGSEYRHWRRAKFLQRFRLFYRYHSTARLIVFVWLNDENTLRKHGAQTDPYHVFREMLERGKPPTDWDDLVAACEAWTREDAGEQEG
jgi:toxin YhaV